MTVEEAIASIQEDIDRLERKPYATPALVARKRAELRAIVKELEVRAQAVDAAEFKAADAERHRDQAEQRTAMLANVLLILGINPTRHLVAPLQEAVLYVRAAAMVNDQRRQHRTGQRASANGLLVQLRTLIDSALLWARMDQGLQQLQQKPVIRPAHGQEQAQAA